MDGRFARADSGEHWWVPADDVRIQTEGLKEMNHHILRARPSTSFYLIGKPIRRAGIDQSRELVVLNKSDLTAQELMVWSERDQMPTFMQADRQLCSGAGCFYFEVTKKGELKMQSLPKSTYSRSPSDARTGSGKKRWRQRRSGPITNEDVPDAVPVEEGADAKDADEAGQGALAAALSNGGEIMQGATPDANSDAHEVWAFAIADPVCDVSDNV